MGVFGAPAVHEDDPERAVRAGLRILEAIADLNAGDPAWAAVRIGINTGEALVAFGRGRRRRGRDRRRGQHRVAPAGVAPVGGVVVGEAT